MVRRIVAAIERFGQGEIELKFLKEALAGQELDFGIASPEPLFLMDVAYDFDFQTETKHLGELVERLSDNLFYVNVKRTLLSHLVRLCES